MRGFKAGVGEVVVGWFCGWCGREGGRTFVGVWLVMKICLDNGFMGARAFRACGR